MYLPILNGEMEEFKNVMDFTTIFGSDMKAVLLGVARDDHSRARKCAMEKPVREHTQMIYQRRYDGVMSRGKHGKMIIWICCNLSLQVQSSKVTRFSLCSFR